MGFLDDPHGWAEEHGYVRYRNPHTGQTDYTDGDPEAECEEDCPDDGEQADD